MTNGSERQNGSQARRIELTMSVILQAGVITSTALLLIGLAMSFVRRSGSVHSLTSYRQVTNPGYAFPHSFSSVHAALLTGDSQGYIMLGLLLLILTPVLRVAASVLLFAYEQDKPMTLITLCVLGILISSYFIGVAT